jgi:hypothetical protein
MSQNILAISYPSKADLEILVIKRKGKENDWKYREI